MEWILQFLLRSLILKNNKKTFRLHFKHGDDNDELFCEMVDRRE